MRSALLALALFALMALAPPARANEQSDLDKGRAAYLARQYDEADARFRAMLDPKTGTLHDRALISQARMYWGAVMLAKGRSAETSALFEKLLLDDPNFDPDPLSFPTEVLDLFIDTRVRIRDRLNEAAQQAARREAERRAHEEEEKRREIARVSRLEDLASREYMVERHSRWLAFVPFGVGQFQNHQNTLGWTFLITESALVLGGAVTLPIYLVDLQYRSDAYKSGDTFRAQEYLDRANAVRDVNLVLFGAFALTAGAGVLQAQLAYVPESVEVRRRPLPQALQLAPVIAPVRAPGGDAARGWTFGISGRF